MEKQIFSFDPVIHNNGCTSSGANETIKLNEYVHRTLLKYKNMIGEYYVKRCWDKYKKMANAFELVSTHVYGLPHLAPFDTISRSYFKLWEILHDFDDILSLSTQKTPMRCAFLAEGPGGFIESFVTFRQQVAKIDHPDTLFGMTLLSTNKAVPNWKLSRLFIEKHNITLLRGSDNTGSLYNLDNIRHMVETIGPGTCDFVTSDGGFDFSNDFNVQEDVSAMLIACEVLATIMLQKEGGSCVIKFFDVCSPATVALVSILYEAYNNIFFIKPHTSRPANSEKYIVCSGFKKTAFVEVYVAKLQDAISKKDLSHLSCVKISPRTYENVYEMNRYFASKQIINITKTICMIESKTLEYESKDNQWFRMVVREQLEHAIRWCHKYNIPVSCKSLLGFRQFIV
jgi:23S rRNA U2552 (ribose-2'-O)-methylase RlmE/FtsJ